MQNRFVSLLVVLLIASAWEAGADPEDRGTKLLGPVQNVTTFLKQFVREDDAWKEVLHEASDAAIEDATYDSQGRLAECIAYLYTGQPTRRNTFTYKKDEIRETIFDGAGQPVENVISALDDDGNVLSKLHYIPDGTLFAKDVYKYNTEGQLQARANFDGVQKLSTRAYTFNENGELTAEEVSNASGELIWTFVHLYKDGRLTERQHRESDGRLLWNVVHEYDADGNRTASIRYSAFGRAVWEKEYEYDERGNWIRETTYQVRVRRRGDWEVTRQPALAVIRKIVYADQTGQ